MNKLDKLIRQAKHIKGNEIDPVHIIVKDYCSACKGECKYWGMDENKLRELTDEKIVFIYGDLPEDDDAEVIV